MDYEDLEAQNWVHLGIIPTAGITPDFRRVIETRYLSTMFLPSKMFEDLTKEPVYDLLVRGHDHVPDDLNPGEHFMAIHEIKSPITLEKIESMKEVIRGGRDNIDIEVVRMPGPAYTFSEELPWQLIRDPTVKEVVWMKWNPI